MTPREELVKMAAAVLRSWRLTDYSRTAHDAAESVVDGYKSNTHLILARDIVQYYRTVSETGLNRLLSEIERKAVTS